MDINEVLEDLKEGECTLECRSFYYKNGVFYIMVSYKTGYRCEDFYYQYGTDYIYDNWNSKEPKTFISDDVKSIIVDCCKKFEERIKYCKENYTYIDHHNMSFYYKRIEGTLDYEILEECTDKYCISGPRDYLQFHWEHVKDFTAIWAIRSYRYDSLEKDPLYVSAIQNKDRNLELRMKDFYYGLTKEEEDEMTQITGMRYLRRIADDNKEFEDVYYVCSVDEYWDVLRNSGFRVCHRATFIMRKGMTYSICELNPKKKDGTNAAPVDVKKITFEEFLKLYN